MSSKPVPTAGQPDTLFLVHVVDVFIKYKLEAILVGNAGAALHGAPVATVDVDFLIRNTPLNFKKINAIAKELGLSVSQPFKPSSDVIRLYGGAAEVDLMLSFPRKSFNNIRSRSENIEISGREIRVAGLKDIIDSKKAANRAKDKAALPVLEEALKIQQKLRDLKSSDGKYEH